MARRKSSSGGGGSNWMDTYGDMVTLLLCFFVMLYAMSSIDQMKWEILVKSFNPNADAQSQIVETKEKNEEATEEVEGTSEPPDDSIENFDELYYALTKYVSENELSEDIEVTQGDGYTFITFNNNIFFEGNSYELKQEGKVVLDNFAQAIHAVSKSIDEIQIMGHTSQAEPNVANEIYSDRFLSSNRATIVLVYLQRENVIEPSKLVSLGYGQFRPISPFDTTEERAKNRRVEILITEAQEKTNALGQTGTAASTTPEDLTNADESQAAQ